LPGDDLKPHLQLDIEKIQYKKTPIMNLSKFTSKNPYRASRDFIFSKSRECSGEVSQQKKGFGSSTVNLAHDEYEDYDID